MGKKGIPKRRVFNWRKWCDEFVLAGKGILLATKEKRFWMGFLIAFLFFGTLMNLLAGGFSKFELMGAVGFSGSMKIIGDALIGVFGVNMIVTEWLWIFGLALLQGTLIGLIVLLWNKKRVEVGKSQNDKNGKRKSDDKENSNSANVEKAGIITGLIALGAGCPTCGTTLLTPLIGTLFAGGGMAVVGTVSSLVTVAAVVISILSLKRIGVETYAIIVNEKYVEKQRENRKNI